MRTVSHFITHRLRLKVNEEKSHVTHPWEMCFRGFRITSMINFTRIQIHPKSIKQLKERVRQLTSRSSGKRLRPQFRPSASLSPPGFSIYRARLLAYFALCWLPLYGKRTLRLPNTPCHNALHPSLPSGWALRLAHYSPGCYDELTLKKLKNGNIHVFHTFVRIKKEKTQRHQQ